MRGKSQRLYFPYGVLERCFQTKTGVMSNKQNKTAFLFPLNLEVGTEICAAAKTGDRDVD